MKVEEIANGCFFMALVALVISIAVLCAGRLIEAAVFFGSMAVLTLCGCILTVAKTDKNEF